MVPAAALFISHESHPYLLKPKRGSRIMMFAAAAALSLSAGAPNKPHIVMHLGDDYGKAATPCCGISLPSMINGNINIIIRDNTFINDLCVFPPPRH